MNITIQHHERQIGPYTVEEVNRRLRDGKIKPDALAWQEGTKDWVPLGSIAGIDGTVPAAPVATKPAIPRVVFAAPVAVKPHTPSVVPVVAKPQISGTPSEKPLVAKPKSRFYWKAWITGIVIVIVWAANTDSASEMKSLPPAIFVILIGLLFWHLFKDSKFTEELTEAQRQQERQKELEQTRERVRQQMQRLVSDGTPYIEGQIIHLVGVSGLAKGSCVIRFENSHASIFLPHGKTVSLPYCDIQLLQIGGKGHFTESVNAGFIGGGFGLGGALKGAAEATFLNAAVAALTRKDRVECELLLRWTTGELLMLNQEHTPEIVSHVLQPIIAKIG